VAPDFFWWKTMPRERQRRIVAFWDDLGHLTRITVVRTLIPV
jgi:hypothetical protein